MESSKFNYQGVSRMYEELRKIYSSPYESSKQEKADAIKVLTQALESGESFDILVFRLYRLCEFESVKVKFHKIILERYWEFKKLRLPNYSSFDLTKE